MNKKLTKPFLLFFTLIFGVSVSEASIIYGPVKNETTGHIYYLLSNNSWTASEAEAVTLGGHLVTINDANENLWVLNTFSLYGGTAKTLWIGLNDAAREGNFVWSSGEVSTYRNWSGNEPSAGSSTEDFVHIYDLNRGSYAGKWNDHVNILAEYGVPLHGVVELPYSVEVSGRVFDAVSRSPLSGANITCFGQSKTSSEAGSFSFGSVSLIGDNKLSVNRSGYATYSRTITAPAGTIKVTIPDIFLQAAGTNPIVTFVEPRLTGKFLSGVTLNNDFTTSVNWNGLTPGSVRFLVNGNLVATRTGTGPEYVATMNMGSSPFRPSFNAAGNQVTVQAVGSGGQMSDPFKIDVVILPLPDPIKVVTGQGYPFTTYLDGRIGLDYDFPNPAIKKIVTLPIIGSFGFEAAANGSFDYTVTDGDWEIAFGVGAESKIGKRGRRPSFPGLTRYPKMKLYIGNKEFSGKIEAGAAGTAIIERGITFNEISGQAELGARLELTRYGLHDLVPGLGAVASHVPSLNEMTKNISIIIWAMPSFDGKMTFATHPDFHFDTLEFTGKVGLEAAYEPKMSDDFELRVYVGGEPSATFEIPGDLFKNVKFRAYAGAEFKAWLYTLGPVEYVFVDVSYPAAKSLALGMRSADGTTGVAAFRVVSADTNTVRTVSREYLAAGPEQFIGADGATKAITSKAVLVGNVQSANAVSPLDAFRSIGRTPSNPVASKGVIAPAQKGPISNAGPQIGQADLPLLENVFPGSDPALAGRGQALMLLYVTDNGSPNDLQFTDIRWTRFDGTNWSTPATIHTNTQAEFSPQVAYDGTGDALAVWERVADSNFNQTNLTAMAAQMEIVWSKWDHTTGQWSVPEAFTANNHLDHAPLLCGPMNDGSLLATWTANRSNLLMGTNGAGSYMLSALWNPVSENWSVTSPISE